VPIRVVNVISMVAAIIRSILVMVAGAVRVRPMFMKVTMHVRTISAFMAMVDHGTKSKLHPAAPEGNEMVRQ